MYEGECEFIGEHGRSGPHNNLSWFNPISGSSLPWNLWVYLSPYIMLLHLYYCSSHGDHQIWSWMHVKGCFNTSYFSFIWPCVKGLVCFDIAHAKFHLISRSYDWSQQVQSLTTWIVLELGSSWITKVLGNTLD